MILFIHGFASCGQSNKYRILAEHFGTHDILAPDLSPKPAEAITQLETLLAQHSVDLLIGSSLGGYYATWLNRENSLPAVLINPAVAPYALLDDYLGEHLDCYGQPFTLSQADLDTLRSYHRPELRSDERYLVLLQTDDEVLDYRQAAAYYAEQSLVIEPGGDHRFQNLEAQLARITAWREHTASRNP